MVSYLWQTKKAKQRGTERDIWVLKILQRILHMSEQKTFKALKVQNICDLQEASTEPLASRHSFTINGMFSSFNSFCLFGCA